MIGLLVPSLKNIEIISTPYEVALKVRNLLKIVQFMSIYFYHNIRSFFTNNVLSVVKCFYSHSPFNLH